MSLLKKAAFVGLTAVLMLFVGVFSLPKQAAATIDPSCDKSASFLGLPTWYAYLNVGVEYARDKDGNIITENGQQVIIDHCAISTNPPGEPADVDWSKAVPLIGLAVLEIMLRVAGLVGFIFVIYGGFRYITSQGEPEKTKTSRQTITNSLIGIVISIIAAAAVSFIANTLTTK